MAENERYALTPGVGVFALFPHMNYKPWYAMAEFVDNSLDSFLVDRDRIREVDASADRLRVVIDIDTSGQGEIRVWDNAGGIHADAIPRAFKTAEPPPNAHGLSQFGVGMKSASAWWARTLTVRTTAIGEPVERFIELDFEQIVRHRQDTFVATTRDASPSDHYTEIKLRGLLKAPQTRTIDKIKRHLASIYRVFIREGVLELTFMGETLSYDELEVLHAPHYRSPESDPIVWKKDITLSLSDGRQVHGFAGLLKTGSRSRAGFALFRHKRLILGSAEDSWRPSDIFGHTNTFRYQRVFGELHLDDFRVAHTKDGFLWEDVEDELLLRLREALDSAPIPLLEQAEGYRARLKTEELTLEAHKALEATASVLESTARAIVIEQLNRPPSYHEQADTLSGDPLHLASERELKLDVQGKIWHIRIDLTNDPSVSDWLTVVRLPDRPTHGPEHLHIRVSLATEFMQRFAGSRAEQLEPLIRLAAGLALAELTARRSGVRHAHEVRRRLNDLLERSLAAPR